MIEWREFLTFQLRLDEVCYENVFGVKAGVMCYLVFVCLLPCALNSHDLQLVPKLLRSRAGNSILNFICWRVGDSYDWLHGSHGIEPQI